jgi:hypothetical protein
VAVAGFATAAALGIWTIRERNELARSCGPTCTPEETAPLSDKLVIADVALGIAAVALAIGAYRYFTRPPTPSTPELKLVVGASRSALMLGRRF